MKRICLSITFSFACLLGAACAEDPAVTCDILWKNADGDDVGTTSVVYEGIDDADSGVAMCGEDQATHEERPDAATSYECSCST